MIFTIPLGVCLVYWLLVVVGALGVDLLDGGGDGVDGGADVDVGDGDVGGGEAEGAAKGLLSLVGFGSAPVTVVVSFLSFFAWTASLVGSAYLAPVLGGVLPGWAAAAAVLAAAIVLGSVLTRLAVAPLRKVFAATSAPERRQLLGKLCTVQSGRVDGRFGQASFDDGGAGLLLNVTCAKENRLKKGDRAVIVDHDPVRDVFEIEPADFLAGGEAGAAVEAAQAEAARREREKVR